MSDAAATSPSPAQTPGFGEFVAIVALVMGLTAFSIDNLLPAFTAMQQSFEVVDANSLQLTVYVYLVGFAVLQLVYGPLADALGRRPVLLIGLGLYAAGSALALMADSLTLLLVARGVQGAGAAAGRVLAIAIVRDRYKGQDMARVMSFVMMIFITVPIAAPAIGSLLLLVSGWRAIFVSMLVLAGVTGGWFWLRMPETLNPAHRMPLSPRRIGGAFAQAIGTRASFGYATAMGLMMGCLMGYIGSAQQIFETEVYGLGAWFPLAFGAVAACMGLASFINARLVRLLGMRRLSHGALLGFVAVSAVLLTVVILYEGRPPLLLFGVLLAACQFLFSVMAPNFNAMAMEPLGAIAGTASSFIGFYTTLGGALFGLAIGWSFDGTVLPLAMGYLILGVLCLGVVAWVERGRLCAAPSAQ